MLTSDFTAEISNRRRAWQGGRQVPNAPGYRLVERLGERRGAVAVEIAFRAGRGTPDHRPDDRRVA